MVVYLVLFWGGGYLVSAMTYEEKIDAIIDIGESINYLFHTKSCPHFLDWQFESIDEALKQQKEIAQSLFSCPQGMTSFGFEVGE